MQCTLFHRNLKYNLSCLFSIEFVTDFPSEFAVKSTLALHLCFPSEFDCFDLLFILKERELDLLRSQIDIMKGSLQDKINETGSLASKIESAEQRIGSRLSQFDLSDIKRKLEAEATGKSQ